MIAYLHVRHVQAIVSGGVLAFQLKDCPVLTGVVVCRLAATQPPLPPLPASADDLLGFSTLPPVKVSATPAALSMSNATEPQQFPGFSQRRLRP